VSDRFQPSPVPVATANPVGEKASASPVSSPAPGVSPTASPAKDSARGHAAVPLPSLKATETITWVKLERPRFAIGEIIVSSLMFVGVLVLVAVAAGTILGQLRSRTRGGTHGTGGLDLR
jgi:hypothetical protein